MANLKRKPTHNDPATIRRITRQRPAATLLPPQSNGQTRPQNGETEPAVKPDLPATTGPSSKRPNSGETHRPAKSHQHQYVIERKPITKTSSTSLAAFAAGSWLSPDGARQGNSRTDRNIDKVVLGNICFRAWYPSDYCKDVLGDPATSTGQVGKKITLANGTRANRDSRSSTPTHHRLYICQWCFKYSKELVPWWKHVQMCERQSQMPGRKVYMHPKRKRTSTEPTAAAPGRGKRNANAQKAVDDMGAHSGEWSIWEVDGEKEVLFCQNLSLFGKLFLDTKSVLFEVAGFKYYLLVYTPPTRPSHAAAEGTSSPPPRGQVVGFFSKEKSSWDKNNLACILVFPPWQRKGLGSLLMGVSYEISRREGLLGGPERPISELGIKGYKRFWAGEIARWIFSLDLSATGDLLVDVRECSRATWIALDDCLAVLREMGVAEDAGKGLPETREKRERTADGDGGDQDGETQEVQLVRISRGAIRSYLAANRISTARTCDADGFLDGPAIPEETENEN